MANAVTFSNGQKMPIVGLGTWQVTNDAELENALDAALEAGYRHIDTAYLYQNEAIIGRVLKRWIDSGKVRREDLFIVTKLPMIGLTPEKAPYFLHKSLASLQLEYVDLYLIHSPVGMTYVDDTSLFPTKDGQALVDMNTDLVAVWKALEAEVDAGKARSLGISNFNEEQVERIFNAARHKPMNIQVELHAYFQQKPLREVCKRLNVTICAYAPVGSPGRAALYKTRGLSFQSNGLLDDAVVRKIAESKGKTPAQVLLKFLAQEEIAVIPKSTNSSRIAENFQIFDFQLSPEEINELRSLDKGEDGRTFLFDAFKGAMDHPEFPFKNRK